MTLDSTSSYKWGSKNKKDEGAWAVMMLATTRDLLSEKLKSSCRYYCQVTSVVSDSVRPHRQQPTRLPRPWDSPGKNTDVGCRFLLQCINVKNESEITQSCLTWSDPMNCSLPDSSVHGIFQARVLEWVAIAFSRKVVEVLELSQNLCPYSLLEVKSKLTQTWSQKLTMPEC